MSYEIIFDKQSIQLSKDNYMTLALGGCSSMREAYSDRISRSWEVLWAPYTRDDRDVENILDYKPWATLDEFKTKLKAYEQTLKQRVEKRGKQYNPKNFWWDDGLRINGGKTSFGQYQGLWIGAAKKSITISRLKRLFGIKIKLELSPYCCKEQGIKQQTLYPRTGAEYMRMYQQLRGETKGKVSIHTSFSWGDENIAKKIRRKLYTRNPKSFERKLVESYFTIEAAQGYLAKLTKCGGYMYSSTPHLKFETKKQAQAKLKYYQRKRPAYDFEVKHIKCSAEIWVPKAA